MAAEEAPREVECEEECDVPNSQPSTEGSSAKHGDNDGEEKGENGGEMEIDNQEDEEEEEEKKNVSPQGNNTPKSKEGRSNPPPQENAPQEREEKEKERESANNPQKAFRSEYTAQYRDPTTGKLITKKIITTKATGEPFSPKTASSRQRRWTSITHQVNADDQPKKSNIKKEKGTRKMVKGGESRSRNCTIKRTISRLNR